MSNNKIYVDDESQLYESLNKMTQPELKEYMINNELKTMNHFSDNIETLKNLDFSTFELDSDGDIIKYQFDKNLDSKSNSHIIKVIKDCSFIINNYDKNGVIERLKELQDDSSFKLLKLKRMRVDIQVIGYWGNR